MSGYDPRDFIIDGRDVGCAWVVSIVVMAVVFTVILI